jgi:hypothetical protein
MFFMALFTFLVGMGTTHAKDVDQPSKNPCYNEEYVLKTLHSEEFSDSGAGRFEIKKPAVTYANSRKSSTACGAYLVDFNGGMYYFSTGIIVSPPPPVGGEPRKIKVDDLFDYGIRGKPANKVQIWKSQDGKRASFLEVVRKNENSLLIYYEIEGQADVKNRVDLIEYKGEVFSINWFVPLHFPYGGVIYVRQRKGDSFTEDAFKLDLQHLDEWKSSYQKPQQP